MGKYTVKTAFELRGRFLGYVVKDTYKVKGMRLATAQGEQDIKLPKGLRYASAAILQPGAWVQVQGQQKTDLKTGQTKLKAFIITPTKPLEDRATPVPATTAPAAVSLMPPQKQLAAPTAGQIRVCQKSSCRKRGSQAIWSALTTALDTAGLTDTVQLQPIKCLGKCKAGPNLMVFPSKTRYSHVRPQQVTEIVASHF